MNILDMSLKEIFKYVAIKENSISIYDNKVPEFAKIVSEEDVNSYLTVIYKGKDVKAVRVDSIIFVPTKKTSRYWEGKRFKLIYNVLDEKFNRKTIGWGWSPNGDNDIYDDVDGFYNSRLDCIPAGLMRRVYFDNFKDVNNKRLYPHLLWVNGKLSGINLLPGKKWE